MNEHSKNIVLIVLGVVLIGITIAYDALQTNLNINGTAESPEVTWDINITNWSQTAKNGNPTITAPTITNTSITGLGVNLTKPGQSVTYAFDIVNDGTIDAKLNSTTSGFTCNSGKICTDITYALNCAAAASTQNSILYASNNTNTDTAHCTLTISRAAGTQASDQTYTSNDGAGTFNASWQYVQN